jgi:hypothetical protein
MSKKKKILFIIGILLLVLLVAPTLVDLFRFEIIKSAISAGGYPYVLGLTGVNLLPCVTTPTTPPTCTGGFYCMTLDPARCTAYIEVSGAPAGGDGYGALFQKTAVAASGLTTGGQLIAGGVSAALMDTGPLASSGGCYNCTAVAVATNKFMNVIHEFSIASLLKE